MLFQPIENIMKKKSENELFRRNNDFLQNITLLVLPKYQWKNRLSLSFKENIKLNWGKKQNKPLIWKLIFHSLNYYLDNYLE